MRQSRLRRLALTPRSASFMDTIITISVFQRYAGIQRTTIAGIKLCQSTWIAGSNSSCLIRNDTSRGGIILVPQIARIDEPGKFRCYLLADLQTPHAVTRGLDRKSTRLNSSH